MFVETPFDSVVDARERLTALERRFRERGDRHGPFLVVYARVTGAVGEAIEAGPRPPAESGDVP